MPPATPDTPSRPAAGDGAHVPVLDGVRGLAILLVMIFHCGIMPSRRAIDWVVSFGISCGWAGVDLFFVLSGFLITGILIDQKGAPGYFRNFYARRVLRIFPLYYAVVALSLHALPHLLPPAKAARFGSVSGDAIYYWLYLSNFAIARAHEFRHGVLDISWSLAIEEQFYLVWPAVVLLCSRRALLGVAGAIGLASLALRLWLRLGAGAAVLDVYVLTPCRMDGLVVGAALAVLARDPGGLAAIRPAARKVARVAGPLAFAVLLHEFLVTRDIVTPGTTRTLGTVGFSVIAVLFGALLVLVVTAAPGSVLARAFGSRLLRTFGKYSYGMYLFHLPVRAVLRDMVFGPSWTRAPIKFPILLGSELVGLAIFDALAFAIILGLAWLSYHAFERRFLDLKRFFPSHREAPAPSFG